MGTTNETDDVKKIGTVNEKMENRSDSIRQEYGFASDVKLKECKYCRVMIPKKAKVCPNCKMRLKNYWFLKAVAGLLVIAVIGMGSYCLSAYWGLTDGSVLPLWFAQSTTSVPVVSTSVAEPVETAAGMSVVEAAGENIVSRAVEGTDEQTEQAAVKGAEDKLGYRETDTDSALVSGSEGDKEQEIPEEGEEGEEGEQEKEPVEEADEPGRENAGEGADGREDARQQAEPEEDKEQEIPEQGEEEEAAFRAECRAVGYKELLRKQEDYFNAAIMVEVQVTCRVGGGLFDENIYYLCKAEEKDGIERYYIIRDDREADDTLILEGDWIMVYGQLFGDCKVPAEFIHTRPVVPAVSMRYLDLEE